MQMKHTLALECGDLVVELLRTGSTCSAVICYPDHAECNRVSLSKKAIGFVAEALTAIEKEARKPQRKRHTEPGEGLDAPSPWRQAMR